MSRPLGEWGEDRAVEYLKERNWTILHRNYRTAFGECDLIAQKEGITAFVEVKTRNSRDFGPPESAIDREKRRHLKRIVRHYLSEEANPGQPRFDVIAILFDPDHPEIRHIPGAFQVNP